MEQTVLQEAENLIHGPRQESYGTPLDTFARTGAIWGAILDIPPIPPEIVGLMMVGLKISREVNKQGRDNLVDGCGYLGTVEMIYEERERREGKGVQQGEAPGKVPPPPPLCSSTFRPLLSNVVRPCTKSEGHPAPHQNGGLWWYGTQPLPPGVTFRSGWLYKEEG